MKKDESFINRHGRRTDMNRIDLSDISVDKDGDVPPDAAIPASHTVKPTRSARSWRPKWSRRTWLIIAGIMLVVVLLPIVVGEVIVASYRADTASVAAKLQAVVSDKVLPSQQKTSVKASVISDMTAQVDGVRGSICNGGLFDNLAKLYPRATSAYNDCIKKTGQLSNLSASLRRLETETRYVEAITGATQTVTAPTTEPFAVTDAQQTNWVLARDAAKKITPPVELQDQHKKLSQWIAAIADGWTALNAAQGAQDRTKFTAAEKDLNTGYENVRITVDELRVSLHQTQVSITAAYKALR